MLHKTDLFIKKIFYILRKRDLDHKFVSPIPGRAAHFKSLAQLLE